MKNRTKIELVLGISFILVISGMGILGRTITSTSDDIETFIRNSNGNVYAVTGPNIQTAIWSLNSTDGGTVYLPEGTIDASGIDLINNITIIGTGYGTHLKIPDNTNDNVFYEKTGVNNVIIENIYFDENVDNNIDTGSTTVHNGIYLFNSNNCTIKNCWFYGFFAHGVLFSTDSCYNIVENCYFEYHNGSALVSFRRSNHNSYKNIYITRQRTENGIYTHEDCHNIFMYNVHCHDFLDGCEAGITVTTNCDAKIINCYITDNPNIVGINIGSLGALSNNNTITGCVLRNLTGTAYNHGCGMHIYGSYNIISNNMFIDIGDIGIYTKDDGKYNQIINNIFQNCDDDPIYLRGVKNFIITNNIFVDCADDIYYYSDINLAENIIKDNIDTFTQKDNSVFPLYVQSNAPTLVSNTTAYWLNTDGPWLYQVANCFGQTFYVNMSDTP